jgi:hypothetical protein
VGALTCSLLGMQVAFVDPGGVTGRGVALLTALALGTLLTELVEARRSLEDSRGQSHRRSARTYIAG